MFRRADFFPAAWRLAVAILLVFLGQPGSVHGLVRRNIFVILADDLGATDLGAYGNRFYSTPNLDRLADEGMRFSHAYAASPIGSPTRGSLLTGRYPAGCT